MILIAKEKHHILTFKCQQCGFCCDNNAIELYPFEIKQLCQHWNISTAKFHEQYAVLRADQAGITKCFLRNRPHCPFKKDGCTVYEIRPIRCRLFPIGRYVQKEGTLYLFPDHKCIGFKSGKKQTVGEWLEQEGVTELEPLSDVWNNFQLQLKEQKLSPVQQVIYRKVFYDFDDRLISETRQKLRPEMDLNSFMANLYEIFELMSKEVEKNREENH